MRAKSTLNQKPKLLTLTSLWRPAHPKVRARYTTMTPAALRLQKTLPETGFGTKPSPPRTAFGPPDRPRNPPGDQIGIPEDDSAGQACPMGPPRRTPAALKHQNHFPRPTSEPKQPIREQLSDPKNAQETLSGTTLAPQRITMHNKLAQRDPQEGPFHKMLQIIR